MKKQAKPSKPTIEEELLSLKDRKVAYRWSTPRPIPPPPAFTFIGTGSTKKQD